MASTSMNLGPIEILGVSGSVIIYICSRVASLTER